MTQKQLDTLLEAKSDRYSHNLRSFLRYRSSKFDDAHRMVVVKDDEGMLYIGIRDRRPGTSFMGCRLCTVLTLAGRAQLGEYIATRGWKTVKTFWNDYIREGVCLLDIEHSSYTHRWNYGRTVTRRRCKYCGRSERQVKVRRVVVETRWQKVK